MDEVRVEDAVEAYIYIEIGSEPECDLREAMWACLSYSPSYSQEGVRFSHVPSRLAQEGIGMVRLIKPKTMLGSIPNRRRRDERAVYWTTLEGPEHAQRCMVGQCAQCCVVLQSDVVIDKG